MKKTPTIALLALAGATFTLHAADLKLEDCPPAVQETIRAQARDGRIDDIDQITIENRTIYVAEVESAPDRDLDVHVAADGKLLKTREDADFAALPAPVQEAAKKLVPAGGSIDSVDKEVANGVTTYEVEIERPQAADLEVIFSESGAVVSQREDVQD